MSNYKCPGSYSPVHAWAVITADFDDDCEAVQNEVMAKLHGDDGWKDPRGGKYTIEKMPASNNGILQVKRVTGNHLFTDRVDFQFIQTSTASVKSRVAPNLKASAPLMVVLTFATFTTCIA